jgi:parallel beta-helix repeat protein
LSQNGLIAGSSASGADDTGIWIETSQNVTATHNVVDGNVAGFEVSNSSDVLLAENEIHGNSVGAAILFLPGIFADQPDNRRITVRGNDIHDNNKINTGQPGSAASFLPSGVGIFHLGSDDSQITGNTVEHHDLSGIALADYCLALQGSPLDCATDPSASPEFLEDNAAVNNRVTRNRLRNNGIAPDPSSPFAFAAGDITVLTDGVHGNCFAANSYATFFSTLGFLPACR